MKKRNNKLLVLLCILSLTLLFSGCAKKAEDDTGGVKPETVKEDSSDTEQQEEKQGTEDMAGDPDMETRTDIYRNSEVNTDLPAGSEIKAFLDAVDMDYAYSLTYELAYNEKHPENAGYLGWRTSGSEAENACADFLVSEMERIGLENVRKLGSVCDRFQFNGSSLTIEGTDISLNPASYQATGTKGDLRAEIVDCGWGHEEDYDGVDVTGKIALVQVDQRNDAWIDAYARQAEEAGAAALVTWAESGYGEANRDTVNVQDLCCYDIMPVAAISANQADMIREAIAEGHTVCTLNIDAEVEPGGGTTYNVCGMIPGKRHDQRIVISGHYDKYWYGFQDDSAAMGQIFTIAKAMTDTGFTPENDIYFVATGSEERGVENSQFDWATGAWRLAEDYEEFAEKTIAVINNEVPAMQAAKGLSIQCVQEFGTLAEKLFRERLVVTSGDVFFLTEPDPTTTMDDNIAWRCHGVPCVTSLNKDQSFINEKYHTTEDTSETYVEDVLRTNINWSGAYAIYIDKMPALELDFTRTADELKANLGDPVAEEAGVDVNAYRARADVFSTLAQKHSEEIDRINKKYLDAAAAGNEKEMAEARDEGTEINRKTLDIFKTIQEGLMSNNDSEAFIGHPTVNDNVNILHAVIRACEEHSLTLEGDPSDVLNYALLLNHSLDYYYVVFSENVAAGIQEMFDTEMMSPGKDQWGYGHQVPVTYAGPVTYKLARTAEEDADWAAITDSYRERLDETLRMVKILCETDMDYLDMLMEMF